MKKGWTHLTRGRIATLGLILLVIIGVAIWGSAGADILPAVRITGFGGGSRVMASTDYDFTVTINPAALKTQLLAADTSPSTNENASYWIHIYGGNDQALTDAKSAFILRATEPRTVCRQGFDLKREDSSFSLLEQTGAIGEPVSFPLSLKISQEGDAHIYASLILYNPESLNLAGDNWDAQNCVDNTKMVVTSTATQFKVEKSWGCSAGVCIIDVNPQELAPDKTGPVQYKVYTSGLDDNSTYAYMSGRYEKPIGSTASDEPKALCRIMLNPPAGSGASQTSPTTISASAGSAFESPARSMSFNTNAPSRRLVAFLLKWDKGTTPSSPCDNVISFAGWSYASAGQGTGGTTVPTPASTSASIDSSAINGGYTGAESLSDTGSPGTAGSFLTGICNATSNITLKLSNSQGSVNLDNAGLMGICTPNVGGQVLKLLMLLAGFFFVVAVIMSGIAMFRATDSSALEQAKKNLIASAIGAFLITFANWIVPAFISLISNLFQ